MKEKGFTVCCFFALILSLALIVTSPASAQTFPSSCDLYPELEECRGQGGLEDLASASATSDRATNALFTSGVGLPRVEPSVTSVAPSVTQAPDTSVGDSTDASTQDADATGSEESPEEDAEADSKTDTPRVIAGYMRYESAGPESGGKSDIIGLSIGLAWDVDNLSYGFIVPYDNADTNGGDINRFGAVGFVQYSMSLAEDFGLMFTGNLNHMFVDTEGKDVSVFGGGPSVSVTYSGSEVVEPSLVLAYQYSTDDTDSAFDYQHLIKTGVNAGFRIRENAVVNVFGIWNYDASDYMDDNDSRSYFDAGLEVGYLISETWSLSLGYKAVLEIENYESDTIYLGTLIRF